ncbi:hypothetical protein Q1695_004517 [Nippostrongylus brasiliensis]|nr:hypothetical protein Q1695_004517 [Nippostrongylus brasiliensis]
MGISLVNPVRQCSTTSNAMPDFFVLKRLFSFVIALLCFTVIVIFMEEYAGDGLQIDHVSKTPEGRSTPGSGHDGKKSSDDCWKYEPISVLASCVPCSDFEIRAIKAKHCVPTGFFDRVNCTQSGQVLLRPCRRDSDSRTSSFHLFAFVNFVVFPASYFFTQKRLAEMNRLAYSRVAQFFDSP